MLFRWKNTLAVQIFSYPFEVQTYKRDDGRLCMQQNCEFSMATQTEDDYEAIYNFLCHHQYPADVTKCQKRVLRRRATANYTVKGGLLFYRKKDGEGSGEWKRVPQSIRERKRILESCHSLPEGKPKLSFLFR